MVLSPHLLKGHQQFAKEQLKCTEEKPLYLVILLSSFDQICFFVCWYNLVLGSPPGPGYAWRKWFQRHRDRRGGGWRLLLILSSSSPLLLPSPAPRPSLMDCAHGLPGEQRRDQDEHRHGHAVGLLGRPQGLLQEERGLPSGAGRTNSPFVSSFHSVSSSTSLRSATLTARTSRTRSSTTRGSGSAPPRRP